jgi:uncharacterized membrane protein
MVRRVVFGILFVLPMVLTVFVVYYIYLILNSWIIEPVAQWIIPHKANSKSWSLFDKFFTPIISLSAILLFFYFLGYAFQTRISRWIDWIFTSIPGVSILYRAVRDASQAMQGPDGLKNIDTVVLVPFPHPGARAAGFLMGESRDPTTGNPLACVYIPIALFPPSGYTLVFPKDEVIITGWDAAAPWKLLLTGGLTLPAEMPFQRPSGI